jgi:hypothetical protein
MTYPRKWAVATAAGDHLKDLDWDSMVDAANGMTVAGGITIQYPYSFIVRNVGGVYDAINSNGVLTYGGSSDVGGVDGADASAVIQTAMNGLTAGRTWKETVKLIGSFTLNAVTDVTFGKIALTIPSYTILDLSDAVLKASDNIDYVNLMVVSEATQVDIIGGEIDGNKTNQTPSVNGFIIRISRSNTIVVEGVFAHDSIHDAVMLYNAAGSLPLKNITVTKCILTKNTGEACRNIDADDSEISHNYCSNNHVGMSAGGNNADIESSETVQGINIEYNEIYGHSGFGINSYSSFSNVSNNKIHGLLLDPAEYPTYPAFYGVQAAIQIGGYTRGVIGTIINDNYITNVPQGITICGQHNTIAGNKLVDLVDTALWSSVAIWLFGEVVSPGETFTSHNTVKNNHMFSTSGGSTTYSYGILEGDANHYTGLNTICNNDIEGVDNPLLFYGTGTKVYDNPGGMLDTCVRAYLSANLNVNAAAYPQLVCDTETLDNSGEYNNTTGVFSPTVSGYYKVAAAVTWTGTVATVTYRLALFNNNVEVAIMYGNSQSGVLTHTLNDIIYVQAGHLVLFLVSHTHSAAQTVVGVSKSTFISFEKVKPLF